MEGSAISGPLEGVRVLDLTQGVCGPSTTKLFADYGAEVLKIERPGGGDPARRIGPFPSDLPHPEKSGVFLDLNTGKHSITLNLKVATGRLILCRLAAESDLIVESFRAGTLERLGLGLDVLHAASPAAALVRISNFGQHGPRRDFEADDMLLYAAGGVLQVTGESELGPLKLGMFAPLMLAASVVAAMTMGALSASRRDREAEILDVSIQEVLAGSMDRGGPNLVSFQYSGALMVERRPADVKTSALPQGVYPCADGYVQVATHLGWFDRFCRTVGREDLLEDERILATLTDYEVIGPEIEAILYPWLLERGKQEVMEKAQANGWPVTAINTLEDVFRDPAFRERGFFVELDHPFAGPLEFPGPPLRLSETPGALRRAPTLSEHTSEVLTERLGFSKQEVVILRQRGVI